MLIPGNHDISFIDKDKIYDGNNNNSLDNFYDTFQMYNSLNKTNKDVAFYEYENIRFILMNSCYGSTINDNINDYGKHYLSANVKELLNSAYLKPYTVMIMHHNLEWYNEESRSFLENYISKKVSVLLVGHSHEKAIQMTKKTNVGTSDIKMIQNLAIQDEKAKTEGFTFNILDTNNSLVESKTIIFNNGIVTLGLENENFYVNNHCNLEFRLNKEFEKSLNLDDNNINYNSYFTFSGMIKEDTSSKDNTNEDISNINDFFDLLEKYKKIAIRGGAKTGKTILSKEIFKHFYNKGDRPILIDATGYNKKSFNFKNAMIDEYEGDIVNVIPSGKNILIIDNADCIRENEIKEIISDTANKFDTLIFLFSGEFDYNLSEYISQIISSDNDKILNLRIGQFTYKRRKILIERYIKSCNYNVDDLNETVKKINNDFRNNILHFALTPSFIIKYLKEYMKKKDVTFNNYDIIYQTDLVERLKSNMGDERKCQLFLHILSELAYIMHQNKKQYLSAKEIGEIIENFVISKQQRKVKIADFLQTTEKAGILIYNLDNANYSFKDKIDLAYFIAYKLKDVDISTSDEYKSIINETFNNLCFGINSDVILFLFLLKPVESLKRFIVEKAKKHFSKLDEFRFLDINKYVDIEDDSKLPSFDVKDSVPDKEDFEKKENINDQEEKDILLKDYHTVGIYEYDSLDYEKKENVISNSFKYIEIVSKIMSSFRLVLPDDLKNEIVDLIYKMPNKTLNVLYDEINETVKKAIGQLNAKIEKHNAIINENRDKLEIHIDFDKIKSHLFLLLLTHAYLVYYIEAQFAVNENTIISLVEFDENNNDNYKLQKLLFYLKGNRFDDFERLSLELKDNKFIGKTKLVHVIAREFLIENQNISEDKRNSYISKMFNDGNGQSNNKIKKDILIESYKRNNA